MQKRLLILSLTLVLILFVASVSAFSFVDWFKHLTGRVTLDDLNNDPALVAHYKFDSDFSDSSSSSLGSSASNTQLVSSGKVNGAASFNGNAQISVVENSALDLTNKGTITAWINGNLFSTSYNHIADKLYSYTLSIQNGRPACALGNSWKVSQTILNTGQWYYITCTDDGNNTKIYINGALDSTFTDAGSNPQRDGGFYIGSGRNFYYFDGLLDELRVYKKALSPDEISVLYNQGSTGGGGGGGCSITNWTCGNWISCSSDGTQSRFCTSNCNTNKTETQNCSVPVEEISGCSNITDTVKRNIAQFQSGNYTVVLREGQKFYRNQYIVLPGDQQYPSVPSLFNVFEIKNSSTGYSSDSVKLQVVLGGDIYITTITSDGSGTITIGGKVYSVKYGGLSDGPSSSMWATLDFPQTSSNQVMTFYNCTITPTCTDSDGGLNYDVKGNVISKIEGTFIDYCEQDNGNLLFEYICDDGAINDGEVKISEYNCQNGCSDGACATESSTCQQLVLDRNALLQTNYGDYYLQSNASETSDEPFMNMGTVKRNYLTYGNNNNSKIVAIQTITSLNYSSIAETEWYKDLLEEAKRFETWSGGSIYLSGDKSLQYYSLSGNGENIYFWISGNSFVVVAVYDSQQHYSQNLLSPEELTKKIQNNAFDYIPGYVFGDIYGIVSQYMNACNSEVNEVCFPEWEKKTEPVICPEYGRQTEVLRDVTGCVDNKETTKYCSPGICSGCYVPRWFGDKYGDKTCIPYGFRFDFQDGYTNKVYESRIIAEMITQTGFNATFSIMPDGTAYAKINSDINLMNATNGQIASFEISFDGNIYQGKAGESLTITPGYHQVDVTFYDSYGNKVQSEGANIEITRIVYSEDPSGRYIEIRNRYDYSAYCDIDGWVKQQKSTGFDNEWAKCQNNYECTSNLCSNGECVDTKALAQEARGFKAFVVRMLCKLGNIFDDKAYNQCVIDNI
ncbi:LamG domain-containing protein [Candidatus Pacearchaeota archaeon]|nr:LamG domain-containing protein [Candidatus Pacearchaeota archaeon]